MPEACLNTFYRQHKRVPVLEADWGDCSTPRKGEQRIAEVVEVRVAINNSAFLGVLEETVRASNIGP